jgi:two-component system, response regulator
MSSSTVIVLIEDNADDELLTKRAFARQQFANPLVVLRDGVEALDYFFGPDGTQNLGGRPHLILLDLNIPRISGIEVLQKLRSEPTTQLIPVVVLTSSDEDSDIREAYKLGVNSYIRKPIDFNKFVEVAAQIGLYWLVVNEPPPVAAWAGPDPGAVSELI